MSLFVTGFRMDRMQQNVAEFYVQAFQKLAQIGKTLILPSNFGDVTSAVSQASINSVHRF
jgi:hypothetical protein